MIDSSVFQALLSMMSTAHPWHGVSPGPNAPKVVHAFIEIVPTDVVKYELCKESGHLQIDRPHNYSSHCPTLYGFIPQTYCGQETGDYCAIQSGQAVSFGDEDPLDICVLTECNVAHGNIFVNAVPIGGLRMIDGGKADDKIIAVLQDDVVYGKTTDLLRRGLSNTQRLEGIRSDGLQGLVKRLKHYFLSYKRSPEGPPDKQVEIAAVYGRREAYEVIARSRRDYVSTYGEPQQRIDLLRRAAGKPAVNQCPKANGRRSSHGK